MARLITQSLISAWAYMFDCAEGQEKKAAEDFERVLRRERTVPTDAMQAGIDFENAVYAEAAGFSRRQTEWESGVRKVAGIIRGAQVQLRISRPIAVDGEIYVVYGILDALRAGIIYDVKFRTKPICKESDENGRYDICGKYLNSPQHPFYFYLVPEAREFQYLVSDGEDIYIEIYRPNECRSAEDIIREFIHSITQLGYLDTYKEKWLAK